MGVVEHEGQGFGVKPGVERVEHGPGHGDAEMGFDHGRRVGQHHGHGVAQADAAGEQGTGQAATAGVGLAPGLPQGAVHDGQAFRVDQRRALDEGQRREGRVVGRVARQVLFKDVRHGEALRMGMRRSCAGSI
jgi:hypothetical protein